MSELDKKNDPPASEPREEIPLPAVVDHSRAALLPPQKKSQFDFINPMLSDNKDDPNTPGLRLYNWVGKYFHDVCEDEFTAKSIPLPMNTHPDSALRHVGLIRQVGSVPEWPWWPWSHMFKALFDEKTMRWRQFETNMQWFVSRTGIYEREDEVPDGVVSVVGTLSLEESQDKIREHRKQQAQERASVEEVDQQHRPKERALSFPGKRRDTVLPISQIPLDISSRIVAAESLPFSPSVSPATAPLSPPPPEESEYTGYDVRKCDFDDDDLDTIIDVSDPSPDFLSEWELLKFIRHYLSRGVILAAKCSNASIVCSGTDDIHRLLGIGYDNILDRWGTKPLKLHRIGTQLVGFNAKQCEPDTSLSFTHHVLLHEQFRSKCPKGHALRRSVDPGEKICAVCKCNCSKVYHHCNECCLSICSTCATIAQRAQCAKEHPLVTRSAAAGNRECDCSVCKKQCERKWFECTECKWNVCVGCAGIDVAHFKHRCLEALNRGLVMQTPKGAPLRCPVPVVVVLFGGGEEEKNEIRMAVGKRWPVLVVEGSGGFADEIVNTLRQITQKAPDPDSDEYRHMMSTIEPKTSSILSDGTLLVVKRGTDIEQFQRMVQDALKGNEILQEAWQFYGLWYEAEQLWAFYYSMMQVVILCLSIATTAASVLQTFMLLLGKEGVIEYSPEWTSLNVRNHNRYYYLLFISLRWLVILLPITITLMISLYDHMNPWAKWSSLRIAARSILREIYQYRMQAAGYSPEAVRLQRIAKAKAESGGTRPSSTAQPAKEAEVGADVSTAASPVNAHAGVQPYESREELLGHMLVSLQKELASSEVKNVTLGQVSTLVPPKHILEMGDTGMRDMTPDDYVRFRLLQAKDEISREALITHKLHSTVNFSAHLSAALGTAIAAISAIFVGYVQAWVALTACLVNSLNRFLDYSRVAPLTELYTKTAHQLSVIEGWWSALGPHADDAKNRSRLVADTEGALQQELEGWAQQLQRGQEEMKQAAEDAKRAVANQKALKEGKDVEEVRRLREMGFDAFRADSFTAALKNPSGTDAANLKRQLLTLNDKLGAPIQPQAKAVKEHIEKAAKVAETALTETKNVAEYAKTVGAEATEAAAEAALHTVSMPFELPPAHDPSTAAALSLALRTVLFNSEMRSLFLDAYFMATATFCSDSDCTGSPHSPCISMDHLSRRSDLSSVSPLVICSVLSKNQAALADALICSSPRNILELARELVVAFIVGKLPLDVAPAMREKLVSELHYMAVNLNVGAVGYMNYSLVLRDPEIKRILLRCGSEKCRECLHTAAKVLSDTNPAMQLLQAIYRSIARIDFEAHSISSSLRTYDAVDALKRDCRPVSMLLHDEMLDCFPEDVQKAFKGYTQLRLQAHIGQIAAGTTESAAFGKYAETLCKDVKCLLMHSGHRRHIAHAGARLGQSTVSRMSKVDLLRHLRSSPSIDPAVLTEISLEMKESQLRRCLSVLQAATSNSFAISSVDRVACMFLAAGLRGMPFAQQEYVVHAFGTLPLVIGLRAFSKDQLLSIIPKDIRQSVFERFDEAQLQDLFLLIREIVCDPLRAAKWKSVVRKATSATQHKIVALLDPFVAQRFVYEICKFDEADIGRVEDATSVAAALTVIGDIAVLEALWDVGRDQQHRAKFVLEFSELVREVYDCTRDMAFESIVERCVARWTTGVKEIFAAPLICVLRDHLLKDFNAVATLLRYSFEDIRRKDMNEAFNIPEELVQRIAQTMRQLTVVTPAHLCSMCEPMQPVRHIARLVKVILVSDLACSLFNEFATSIRTFDLRNLIQDPVERFRLPYAFAVVALSNLSQQFFKASKVSDSAAASAASFDEDDSEFSIKRSDLLELRNRLPCVPRGAEQGDKQRIFAPLFDQMKVLTDAQASELFCVARRLLLRSKIGELFLAFCVSIRDAGAKQARSDALKDRPGTPIEKDPDEAMLFVATARNPNRTFELFDITFSLASVVRGDAAGFRNALSDFNVPEHFQLHEAERRIRLQRIVADEDLVGRVRFFDASHLQALIFMLRYFSTEVLGLHELWEHRAALLSEQCEREMLGINLQYSKIIEGKYDDEASPRSHGS